MNNSNLELSQSAGDPKNQTEYFTNNGQYSTESHLNKHEIGNSVQNPHMTNDFSMMQNYSNQGN